MALQATKSPRKRHGLFKRLRQAVPLLQHDFGVKRIGIFGSFARGEETRTSDVDVLVEFEKGQATLHNFIGLADFLESFCKRKVDLLTVEGINQYIRPRIDTEVIWLEG